MKEKEFMCVMALARARVAQGALVNLGPALGLSLEAASKWRAARGALADLVETLMEEADVRADEAGGPTQSLLWGG